MIPETSSRSQAPQVSPILGKADREREQAAGGAVSAKEWQARLPPSSPGVADDFRLDNGVTVRPFVHRSYRVEQSSACRDHLLAVRLAGTVRLERVSEGRVNRATTHPGSLTLTPAHQTSEWTVQGQGEALCFFVPDPLLRRVGAELEAGDTFSLVDRFGVTDPRLERLVAGVAAEMSDAADTARASLPTSGRLYIETLTTQIVVLLMRHHSTARIKLPGGNAPTLRPRAKRAVSEYVEAHLADNLPLGELAAVAGLGIAQFSASFRASFGCSPYQHVLRRRVAHAVAMLKETDLSIAEVAAASGFGSQAHFTTTCRRISGRTPSVYRAETLA